MLKSPGYEAFCMADPWFYDTLQTNNAADVVPFTIANRPIPSIWRRSERGDWLSFSTDANVPDQGWKIHASSCLHNAEKVLRAVWRYCVPRGIAFEFLRSPAAFFTRVSRYAADDSSCELVTIYPADNDQCQRILNELGARLAGEPHPRLLDCLRWEKGPLHVSYGSFAPRECRDDAGRIVPAVEDDHGNLVPERHGQPFTPPPWVTLPAFLQPHFDARNVVATSDLSYTIERTLQLSAGGGVYIGHDSRTGGRVLMKAARPHSGLDAIGNDAVQRLEHEYRVLRRLAGVPGVPAVHDLIWYDEYRICIMEFLDGDRVGSLIDRWNPLGNPSADVATYAAFTTWAKHIYDRVTATLDAIHERGLAYGELHPSNIIVDEDGNVGLLNFESVATLEAATSPTLGSQGFAAPPGVTGMAVDEYALACLKIALFLPLTELLWLHQPKVRQYAELIRRRFPIPAHYLDDAVETISPAPTSSRSRRATRHDPDPELFTPERWPDLRDNVANAIISSATPGRTDRLFPGDIRQFSTGGLGLAHGAAGVLHALAASGAKRFHDGEAWLIKNAMSSLTKRVRPGFLEGFAGVAFALDSLGHEQAAFDVVETSLRQSWEQLPLDLATGVSGVGLNLLHLADRTGEPSLRLAAHKAIEIVDFRLQYDDTSMPRVGLLGGLAGPALLLIRAYDECGDSAYLDLAAGTLRRDLNRCAAKANGFVGKPYFDSGSVGIGFVLDEYLRRRYDECLAAERDRITVAASKDMYRLPGLFSGRAGSLAYLAACSRAQGVDPATDPRVRTQLGNFAWHALPYRGGVAFPGNALLRLSMDLATGTAGVLLAIASALNETHAPVSLLGSATEISATLRQHPTHPEVGHPTVSATR